MFAVRGILLSDHQVLIPYLTPDLDSLEFGEVDYYFYPVIGRQASFPQCFLFIFSA